MPTYRFGILAPDEDGFYHLQVETSRIPRRYKATGFRFGVEFTDPDCAPLDWYVVLHFPAAVAQATGTFNRSDSRTLRSSVLQSDEPTITDDIWFDEGDPLGRHRMELVVNDVQVYGVDFDVVAA